MNIFSKIAQSISDKINQLKKTSKTILASLRRAKYPLSERILSDALQLSSLPSPTEREETRVTFIVERLESLGIPSSIDESGHLIARLHSQDTENGKPILLVSALPSEHWHPTGSLGGLIQKKPMVWTCICNWPCNAACDCRGYTNMKSSP